MATDRSRIRVKAMLIAPSADGTAHAVSVHQPTLENPHGYHRLIGGSVELGESHRDAILREVAEELGATVSRLTYLGVTENIFHLNGHLGHEIVFLYAGHLDPEPAPGGATLVETDGAEVPVVWRPFHDADVDVPLYPTNAATWLPQGCDESGWSTTETAVAFLNPAPEDGGATPRPDRDDVRAAVHHADTDALLGVLTGREWPEAALQLLGDAVLVVAGERRHDIEQAARRCLAELRERGWDGDRELAVQIESLFGWGPAPLLRSLPVDLEELAGVLEGDPVMGGGRIDLRTGEVWPQFVFEDGEVGDDDPEDEDEVERWLPVHSEGSRAGYRDMEFFIDTVDDDHIADRLARAIRGRGAFRRFKDELADWPDLLDRWYGFTDDRHRGRARAWLAGEGYTPAPLAASTTPRP